ncbi:MAG: alpha/beta hydrolase fold domain-containing protein [Abditibacteriales bacterium]|nr:alpha/beta hydrolase fold domain-containing protein [Abditibacteriales bacterium]MDW8364827.1 alpha/beta hydrolase fold domain-containing protein [Abditibacteriales bacterium]
MRHLVRRPWQGLLLAAWALLGASRLPAQQGDDARSQRLLRRFPQADTNKDGRLDPEELRAFIRARRRGGEPMTSSPPPPATSPASSASTPLGVTITTPARLVRVNPRVYGLNCAEMITKGLLDVPEYVEAIAELRLKTLQFPGGSASYWHHPTGKGGLNARPEEVRKSARGEQSRWMQQTSGPDRFGQYLELCKRSGAEALFIANIMHGNPQEMDAFLERIRAAGVGIAAVALGQEMHLSPGAVGLTLEEYLRRIGPHIELLKKKYPGVLIAVPATPVGRVDSQRRERLRPWNQALAKVPGLDGFTQYGWTEFGGMGLRAQRRAPEEGWPYYRDFVRAFPTEQILVYQRDFGEDKKFLMTQWGTHADQNTPLQGVHLAHMYFFLVRHNAAHNDYFAAANLSVPLAAVAGLSGRGHTGILYRDRVTLLAAYLYSKPFRHLFDGQSTLLDARPSADAGEAQSLAARAGDGALLLYLLNPGPRRPLGQITLNGSAFAPTTRARVESAYAAPEGSNAPVAVFVGEKPLGEVTLEPWSLTLLRLAENPSRRPEPSDQRRAARAGRSRAPFTPPPGITEKEFVYKKTPQGALRLIVTFPADWKPSDRRPGVVFFSGGAWANSLINQFKDRAEYFAGRGMVAARADYRAFKSHGTGPDKAVEDARSAIRWLRAHAAELGLDPNRLAAGGSSAGGHLSACTASAAAPDDPADDLRISCVPNALLMVNCVADFEGMDETEKFKQRVPGGAEMGARLSPVRHLGPNWPPTLILDGDLDRWFGLAKTFVDKLTAHGVRAELWIAPGEGHPFSNFSPWREASIAKMDEFLASLGWLQGPPPISVPPSAQWKRHTPSHKTPKG